MTYMKNTCKSKYLTGCSHQSLQSLAHLKVLLNNSILWLLLLALLLSHISSAQQQYLKAHLTDCVLVQPESWLSSAELKPTSLLLKEIAASEDAYFNFSFLDMDAADDISFSLEDSGGGVYYQVRFQAGQAVWSDHSGASMSLAASNYNNRLFQLKKCGASLVWYQADDIPLLSQTLITNSSLLAKVKINAPSDTRIDLVFETGVESCKASNTSSTALLPGDIMFAGYESSTSGTQLLLLNLVPLPPNTSFQLLRSVYYASAQEWRELSSGAGNLAIQQISYTGKTTIAAGTRICLYLPNTGFGKQLLARDFQVNGQSSDAFLVENVGNSVNPKIELSPSAASAIFLTQGAWKLNGANGMLFGRVLSGLQYGGTWTADNLSIPSGSSHIPEDIKCFAIEDKLPPASRYAFYSGQTLDVQSIANFGQTWGSGAVNARADMCMPIVDTFQEPAASRRTAVNSESRVSLYPNPFSKGFSIYLQLEKPQRFVIKIYDSTGKEIYTQAYADKKTGEHIIPYDFLSTRSSGLFWVRVQLEDQTIVKRLVKTSTL